MQESRYELRAQVEVSTEASRRGGLLWVAAGACLWGTDTILRAPLTQQLSSTSIVLLEHLILGLTLLPVLWLRREEWLKMRRSEWLAILAIAWGGSALGTLLFTEAVRQGNPTTAILLQKSQPVFAALLSGVFLLEPLGFPFWSRLMVALAGAYLIQFGYSLPHGGGATLGPMLALAAAALWGASTVLGRFVLRRTSFLLLTALRILVAIPPLALMAALQHTNPWAKIDGGQASRLFLLSLIPGFAALLLYYHGLSRTRASQASIAELCFPATAVVLNWYFLGTPLSMLQVTGFLLLSGAILSWEKKPVVVTV